MIKFQVRCAPTFVKVYCVAISSLTLLHLRRYIVSLIANNVSPSRHSVQTHQTVYKYNSRMLDYHAAFWADRLILRYISLCYNVPCTIKLAPILLILYRAIALSISIDADERPRSSD